MPMPAPPASPAWSAFRREDLFQTPLAEADVLTLYLTQEVNLRLRPRILAQMRPGTRVVSHDFDMGDWRWDQRRRVGAANIYLWIVPARVAGDWTLTQNGRSVPLVLEQLYQQITGTAGDARVEQGRLNGADIRFIANLGERPPGLRRPGRGRHDRRPATPMPAGVRVARQAFRTPPTDCWPASRHRLEAEAVPLRLGDAPPRGRAAPSPGRAPCRLSSNASLLGAVSTPAWR